MAFLNDYKRRAVRRNNEYQVIMEDLVNLGIVKEEDYNKLIGRIPRPANDYPLVPQTPESPPDTDPLGLNEEQMVKLEEARKLVSDPNDIEQLNAMTPLEQYAVLKNAGLVDG
jgi:hypothetical protein